MAFSNGIKDNPIPELPHPRVMAEMLMSMNRSTLGNRMALASRAGKSFGGDRNLFHTLGYPEELTYQDYLSMYKRGDIAQRIVEAPVEDTWRNPPELREGDGDTADSDTLFVKMFDEFAQNLDLWNQIEQLDAITGIGHFGILLIGLRDGGKLDTPVSKLSSLNQVIYLKPYDEGQVTINKLVTDKNSPNYGLPEMYTIAPGEGESFPVHHSRVIHVVERPRFSRLYGQPRMEPVYNRLMDLHKVIGSSAEAYWKLIYKGVVLSSKDGYGLPSDSNERTELENKVDDYVNDMRRFLVLDGMEMMDLGSQNVDPSSLVDVLFTDIASTKGIPKRILLGSELGELASSQDAAHWAGRITSRRTKYAEGRILRPLMRRLAEFGAIELPAIYSWYWKPLFEMSDTDKSTAAKSYAEALTIASGAAAAGAVDMAEFREKMTPFTVQPDMMPDPFDIEPDEDIKEPDVVPNEEIE
ncbi:MAG: anti-CBASS Acb1 family protein [Candidatus Promineifilaceae bacterium]